MDDCRDPCATRAVGCGFCNVPTWSRFTLRHCILRVELPLCVSRVTIALPGHRNRSQTLSLVYWLSCQAIFSDFVYGEVLDLSLPGATHIVIHYWTGLDGSTNLPGTGNCITLVRESNRLFHFASCCCECGLDGKYSAVCIVAWMGQANSRQSN